LYLTVNKYFITITITILWELPGALLCVCTYCLWIEYISRYRRRINLVGLY